MPGSLDRESLQADIYSAFESMISGDLPEEARSDAEATMENLSKKLSIAIKSFVKTGTVSTTIDAVTTDGATVEGKGTGSIS